MLENILTGHHLTEKENKKFEKGQPSTLKELLVDHQLTVNEIRTIEIGGIHMLEKILSTKQLTEEDIKKIELLKNIKALNNFIYESPIPVLKTYQRKARAIIGPVEILRSVDIVAVALVLQRRLGLTNLPISMSRKWYYAFQKKHYKDGSPLACDISVGKIHRHPSSYR